ncbi:hypothetical protein BGX21_004560 [Mortierella sp. AD011]|nr:hypothetical protein BGX20_001691 [Mortierella sp. AD010]KAF9373108.1 hypothetical protein BGX21_004560 [Mortierella sp. AD011]
MDSTRPESQLFSPSLKKSHRASIPRKTTPSRLYLRQSFPTLESPTLTSINPGESFKQLQQQLEDARDEQEVENNEERQSEQEKQLKPQEAQHISEETGLNLSSDTSGTLPTSSSRTRHTQAISETLTRIIERKQLLARTQGVPSDSTPNPVSVAPRLRTTETEYDLSPTRSARLSTPPRSLYTGTPSKIFLESWDADEFQELGSLAASPSNRHSRNRNAWMTKTNTKDKYPVTRKDLSPRYTAQDDVDEEGFLDDADGQEERNDLEENEYDDQGYNYGDDEVSFKRPALASSLNQSTSIERDLQDHRQPNRPQANDLQDQDYSDSDANPIYENTPSRRRELESMITPQQIFVVGTEAEDSLLEVAERTTAIAEELRGVYSNLQEFFSPESEAKLNGAVSVLSSKKDSSDRHSAEMKVFEASPEAAQRPSIITKRKPAPLRPALILKQNRVSPQEQRQRPQQDRQVKKQHHDIALRGLISDAESARRLNQGNKAKHSRKSPETVKEHKSKTRHVTPEIPNFDNDVSGDNQERFRKKLERWKRAELQSQYDPPTYPDLYIPTISSRSIIHTDTELEDEDLEPDLDEERPQALLRPPNHKYNSQVLQDLNPQMVREKELRYRKGRRVEQAEEDEEEEIDLLDRRSLSKRRREEAFWS